MRILEVTPANESDMNHFQARIDTSADRQQVGKTIHADCGYDSAANRQTLKANKQRDGVARNDDRKRYDQTDIHARNYKLLQALAHSCAGGACVRCLGEGHWQIDPLHRSGASNGPDYAAGDRDQAAALGDA